jgi:hypothetical protein
MAGCLQDEESLLKAATNQPISVGICASSSMQFYSRGVIDTVCAKAFGGSTETDRPIGL